MAGSMSGRIIALATILLLGLGGPAEAHVGEGLIGGFASGLLCTRCSGRTTSSPWSPSACGAPSSVHRRSGCLPVVFPLVMAGGGALGVLGVPMPAVETGIAPLRRRARPDGASWPRARRCGSRRVIVGAFAIFHGYAHGAELPAAADPRSRISVGFVLATGLLHLLGIAFGLLVRWPAGRIAVRATGTAIALAGVVFLIG